MRLKILSSLEKCFLDEDIEKKIEYTSGSMMKNESFHFQVCYVGEKINGADFCHLTIESELADYVTVWRIENVPVQRAVYNYEAKHTFLRSEPGLYPDLMQPMEADGRLIVTSHLKSLMIEVDVQGKVPPGTYPITFCFTDEADVGKQQRIKFELEVIDYELPKQNLIFTQWFYCDSLKDYYETETFDERHFVIIEKFARLAVRYGVNMLLTPVFTPPLDTYVGGERPTIQLVGVNQDNGKYSFDFTLLGRWIEMCDRIGIQYFEISHLFTQWGAKAAPKIMATVDGEYQKIFGWETDATSKEYAEFLECFLKAFLEYMKSQNRADRRCYFHISDEPEAKHLESYLAAKKIVEPLLKDYCIVDALSDYEFYSSGVSKCPIPITSSIDTFIEHGVKDLWTYYCGDQMLSNRFISMPSGRNRIIGAQLYKYGIKGFLHWGYNFYYNQFSHAFMNPFMNTCGDYFTPAGDCFSVYPGPGGTPWPSIRLIVFYDALQDIRAFELCESLYDRQFVMDIIECKKEPITFRNWPDDEDYLIKVRERINLAIKKWSAEKRINNE